MACCVAPVSWECCYPDPCSCCAGCISCACCNGSDCNGGCNSTTTCGKGGCCICDSSQWGFAWKESCPCGMCPGCGAWLYFVRRSSCGGTWYAAQRFDTHNPSASTIADLTKAFFMNFAPLSVGIVTDMVITDNLTCC